MLLAGTVKCLAENKPWHILFRNLQSTLTILAQLNSIIQVDIALFVARYQTKVGYAMLRRVGHGQHITHYPYQNCVIPVSRKEQKPFTL